MEGVRVVGGGGTVPNGLSGQSVGVVDGAAVDVPVLLPGRREGGGGRGEGRLRGEGLVRRVSRYPCEAPFPPLPLLLPSSPFGSLPRSLPRGPADVVGLVGGGIDVRVQGEGGEGGGVGLGEGGLGEGWW